MEEIRIIVGQALGITAAILTALSYQARTKERLLIIQIASIVATILGYLFLDAMSGFALNIVCLVRNVCFYFQKPGGVANIVTTALCSVAMIVLGIMSWQGPSSLLVILGLVINNIALATGRPQILRYSIFITSPMVLAYNIIFVIIGGIFNETIAIISSLVGVIRFYKSDREESVRGIQKEGNENRRGGGVKLE